MSVLKRTQMYFCEDVLLELKRKAREENTSIADIVRNAISEFLAKEKKKNWINDPLWNIAGSAHSKDKDLSINHDKYLYGKNK
ncbi:MAG: CopG family transcriptional regulator [bacterium]